MTEEVKTEETNEEVAQESQEKRKDSRGGRKRTPRKPGADKKASSEMNLEDELDERVVAVNRCAKVVKGGRRFSFSALIVIGDKKGKVGFGLGKAKEVPEAIRKAKSAAQKAMIQISLDGGTIPHEILGEHDAGKILFKPAAEGTGVKAAGACRSILELAGVRNILTKSLRGNNPHNVVKATFKALGSLRTATDVAQVRGMETKRVRIKR